MWVLCFLCDLCPIDNWLGGWTLGYKASGTGGHGKRNILGPALRYYRQNKGISAEEIAARIELDNQKYDFQVSANHLHKVERQEKPITDFLLLAYSEALEIPIQLFFEKAEDKL